MVIKLCNVVKYVTILIILGLILDWNTRFGSERGTSSGTDWVAETKRSVCTSSLMTFFMCIFLRVLFTLWMENVFHCIGSGKLTTFYVGLFIPLRIVPYALSPLWMESWNVTIQMKATERYFPWYCFFCYAELVVLTFESVDHINLEVWPVSMKALSSTFLW